MKTVSAGGCSLSSTDVCVCVCVWCAGAGIMGLPVRGGHGAATRAGLQGYTAAAELLGAVGHLARQRRQSGPQALRGQAKFP